MKPTRLLILVLAVVLLAGSASAFDNMRKGFVMGGGLGVAPVASWSTSVEIFFVGSVTLDENNAGIGANIVIGYAWDEQNMIVYEANVAATKSDFFIDRQVGQGYSGPVWYHYFKPDDNSFFTAAGLGFYYFKVEDFEENDLGLAYLIGGGYEFARHVQVGAYLSGGKTSDRGIDFNHQHLSILVSAVAF
jgi:hypothetical protein